MEITDSHEHKVNGRTNLDCFYSQFYVCTCASSCLCLMWCTHFPNYCLSVSHRTIEWIWLERSINDHSIQQSGRGQGHFTLDYFAQSSIQPNFKHFQWWDAIFPGQALPVLHQLPSKLPIYTYPLSVKTIALCPFTTDSV